MIEGIDIFAPRESGLPDFTRISPGQIFNGSVAASLNSMKDDPFGLSGKNGNEGVEESPWKNTTIDRSTGKRVEVRKAKVVEEMLSGGAARRRGHIPINGDSYRAPDYGTPDQPVDLPTGGQGNTGDNILLNAPPPDGTIVEDPSEDGTLFPGVTPEQQKTISLGQLPTLILEELKNLNLLP